MRISLCGGGQQFCLQWNGCHIHISLWSPQCLYVFKGPVLSCECAHQLMTFQYSLPDSKMFKKCFIKKQMLIYMDQFSEEGLFSFLLWICAWRVRNVINLITFNYTWISFTSTVLGWELWRNNGTRIFLFAGNSFLIFPGWSPVPQSIPEGEPCYTSGPYTVPRREFPCTKLMGFWHSLLFSTWPQYVYPLTSSYSAPSSSPWPRRAGLHSPVLRTAPFRRAEEELICRSGWSRGFRVRQAWVQIWVLISTSWALLSKLLNHFELGFPRLEM